MGQRWRLRACTTLAAVLAVSGLTGAAAPLTAEPVFREAVAEPNVVLIVLDDATVEDLRYLPNVQSLLVRKGTTFRRAYAPMPQCCPARATILTGQYPHNHGVLDIKPPLGGFSAFDDSQTIATYLDPDYETLLLGKYMNDFSSTTYQSPGWDDWRVPSEDTTYNYVHQDVNINGTLTPLDGYIPDEYGEQARQFVADAPSNEPFFAYLSWVAPHGGTPRIGPPQTPYVSARYRDRYDGPRLPRDASYDEKSVGDKPDEVGDRPPVSRKAERRIATTLVLRREALLAVDRQIGRLFQQLRDSHELQSTYVMLTSDNGFMQGQHRITTGKLSTYEPSARVPLVVRGPGFVPGAVVDDVAGLQDLTPTILDLTGTELPNGAPPPDGVSLARLVDGSLRTKRDQLLEIASNSRTGGRADGADLDADDVAWQAQGLVTADGWKYVEYPQSGERELYGLDHDPDELRNLSGEREQADRVRRLSKRLADYAACAGATCRG